MCCPAESWPRDGAGTEVALVAGVLRTPPSQLMQGADVIVSVRPEHFRVQDEGELGQLSGIVKVVMPLGPQVIYDVEIPGGTGVKISQPRDGLQRSAPERKHHSLFTDLSGCVPYLSCAIRAPRSCPMSIPVSRRHLLGTGAAFGAAALIPVSLPVSLRAQGKTLVAATFPGTWNEAHREFLAPAFTKRTGASVTQSILLGNDQLSRLMAAKGGKPPFDVALFDSPQVLDAAKQGLIVEYPARQVAELQGSAAGVPGQVGPAHYHADRRDRLQPAEDQDSAEELGCVVGSAIQGAGRAHGSEQPARHCLSRRDQPLARRERGELRAGIQGAAGNAAECRGNRRKSRRLCNAMAAGADRHRAVQFQFRADPQGKGCAGRAVDPGHGRGRLVHQHARRRQCCRARPRRRSTSIRISIRPCRARWRGRHTTSSRPTAR